MLYNVFQLSPYGHTYIFGFRLPYDRAERVAEDRTYAVTSDYQAHPIRRGDQWVYADIYGREYANTWIEPANADRQWEFVYARLSCFTADEIQQLEAVNIKVL